MKIGYFRNELKNKIMLSIITNSDIVKAIVVGQEDFLETSPTSEETTILNNPELLIRTQVYPYKKLPNKENKDKNFITMEFMDFEKVGRKFKRGLVYFYIITPNALEETTYGSRYDYIVEKLEEIFAETGIGRFEFYKSGDMSIDTDHLGAYVAFEILDFYGW